jgi:hypothetical protein
VCEAGFEAAANDMIAGESAANSAIASNATIFALISFPSRVIPFRKYKSRLLKAVQQIVVRLHLSYSWFFGLRGQSPATRRQVVSYLMHSSESLELVPSSEATMGL